jgi:hypothetical protein
VQTNGIAAAGTISFDLWQFGLPGGAMNFGLVYPGWPNKNAGTDASVPA